MEICEKLLSRASHKCEICLRKQEFIEFHVKDDSEDIEDTVLLCTDCVAALQNFDKVDSSYWYCVKQSLQSEVQPVKILSYRILNHLKEDSWAKDCLAELTKGESISYWLES